MSNNAPGKVTLWIGRILSGLVFAFMALMPAAILAFKPEMMRAGMKESGFPEQDMLPIVLMEIGFTLLYVIRPTSVLGGLLLTAYLGGATLTHMRLGQYPQMAFPIIVGVVVWAGLFFREPRLRTLVPIRW